METSLLLLVFAPNNQIASFIGSGINGNGNGGDIFDNSEIASFIGSGINGNFERRP